MQRPVPAAPCFLQPSPLPTALRVLGSALSCLLVVACCCAEDPRFDEIYLDGLRQRRQFELASSFCRERLDSLQDPAQRLVFTVQLIRVHAEEALYSPAAERAAVWRQAENAAAKLLSSSTDNQRNVFVAVEVATGLVALGELQRIEAEFAADREQAMGEARAALRAAARRLEDIDGKLTQAVPLATEKTATSNGLGADELRQLRQHVQSERARVLRNRALCYSTGSSDRVAALTACLEQLQATLSSLAADDPFAVRLTLDKIVCLRLLDDFKEAREALNHVPIAAQEKRLRWRVIAERARLLIAEGQPQRALESLPPRAGIRGTPADVEFARFQAVVELWRRAAEAEIDDRTAAKWRNAAVSAAEAIKREHGSYWGRRADLALVAAGQVGGGGSLAILGRTAANLFTRGQLQESLAVFDQAAAAAIREHQPQLAFEMQFKAALVQQRRSQYLDASDRLRNAALRWRSDHRAATAHLAAITAAAEAIRHKQADLSGYSELLQEHLSTWPVGSTVAQAEVWHGELQERQRNWPAAVNAFQNVLKTETVSDESLSAAFGGLERCLGSWLPTLSIDREREVVIQTTQLLDRLLSRPTAPAVSWQAGVLLARLSVLYLPSEAHRARDVLQSLLSATNNEAPPRDQWRMHLYVCLCNAVQPTTRVQHQCLHNLTLEDDWQVLEMLEIVRRAARRFNTVDQDQGANAQLLSGLTESLLAHPARLEEQQHIELRWRFAQSVAASDPPRAIELLRELAAGHPKHAGIQRDYGELLLSRGSSSELEEALAQWRRIAQRTRPRTSEWFQAKHAVATAMVRLGQREAARKFIRYLQVTEDLKKAGFDEAFEKLLAETD